VTPKDCRGESPDSLRVQAFGSLNSSCIEHLSPAAGHDTFASAYERHRPEETVLYGVVQSELESFLACERDWPLLRFVEREFHSFLDAYPPEWPLSGVRSSLFGLSARLVNSWIT
jgi:hypothetical protein